MGLSSSKSKTTSQATTTSAPNAAYQPYIDAGASAGLGLLNSQQPALNNIGQQAMSVYNGLGTAQNTLGSIYSGTNPAQSTYTKLQAANQNDPSLSTLYHLSEGSTSPGNYDGIGSSNPALAQLQQMASGQVNGDTSQFYKDTLAGKYLNGNPYVDAMAQQATDAATKAQNQRFAMAGMDAGMSTPYSTALGQAVADANNSLRYQNYNAERQLQQQAAGMSDSEYNATQDRNLSAANSLGSLYNQTGSLKLSAQQAKDAAFNNDRSNQLAAAQALGNQNTADNATALNATNGNIQSMLSALGLSNSTSASQLAALAASAQLPWSGLNAYAGDMNSLVGKYMTSDSSGTQTTKSTPSIMDYLMQMQANAAKAAAGA
jgi:hypothetical protein